MARRRVPAGRKLRKVICVAKLDNSAHYNKIFAISPNNPIYPNISFSFLLFSIFIEPHKLYILYKNLPPKLQLSHKAKHRYEH